MQLSKKLSFDPSKDHGNTGCQLFQLSVHQSYCPSYEPSKLDFSGQKKKKIGRSVGVCTPTCYR